MAKSKTKHVNDSESVRRSLGAACQILDGIRAQCRGVRSDWLLDNNVCPTCEWRGTVRHRDTIDYQHDYQIVPCPDCDGVNRRFAIPEFTSPELTAAMDRADDLRALLTEVHRLEARPIGLDVEVIAGRLAAPGRVLHVSSVYVGNWGTIVYEGNDGRAYLGNVRVIGAEAAARKNLRDREEESARRIRAHDLTHWALQIDLLPEDVLVEGREGVHAFVMAKIDHQYGERMTRAARWVEGVTL